MVIRATTSTLKPSTSPFPYGKAHVPTSNCHFNGPATLSLPADEFQHEAYLDTSGESPIACLCGIADSEIIGKEGPIFAYGAL